MRRLRRRGQAAVEMALFAIVFVTVLIFGIHFAEIGYLSIKVQSAANSALWDTTAKKMHDTFNNDWTLYRGAIAQAGPETEARLTDVDITQVFTRAHPIEVTCERADPDTFLTFKPIRPVDAAIASEETGMTCTARAAMEGYRIPRFFLENDQRGFFNEQHWEPRQIPICAAGRASGGDCPARYGIALDDWGFSGKDELKECPLAPEGGGSCSNQGYYDMVKRSYRKQANFAAGGLRGDASDLAEAVVGKSPIDENHFYMSFRGSESQYTDSLGASHQQIRWETTPWKWPSAYSQSQRDNCWLGRKCER
jgi:hypothetical protein